MRTNKAVVESYMQYFNAGDLEGLRTVFADDALVYGVMGWGKVADVMPIWKQLVECLHMHLRVEAMITDGDIVAARFIETGLSAAPFFDHPATGNSYELTAMEWFELADGKIRRRWGARDAASQARQLGWDRSAGNADVGRAGPTAQDPAAPPP